MVEFRFLIKTLGQDVTELVYMEIF